MGVGRKPEPFPGSAAPQSLTQQGREAGGRPASADQGWRTDGAVSAAASSSWADRVV